MWRTVSARLRGSETELKEMGEDTDGLVTSTSKLQALVKGITGFDIMKDKDTYKDIYDIVLGIGEKWKDLSDINRASLLEALAIGLPVISTDHPIGGARMLIKSGENGVLTPVGDKESMKNAILNVLTDNQFALKISTNAVTVREKASISTISHQWLDFVSFIIYNK